VDIAFAGFYLHEENKLTDQVKEFVSRFPDWTVPYFAFAATYTSQSF